MSEKRVNCPFCGGGKLSHRKQEYYNSGDPSKSVWIYCSACGAEGPIASTEEWANKKWDKRAKNV